MISTVSADAASLALYGGKDPRDLPRYTYPEGARATGVPASTIMAWVRGQQYKTKRGTGFFRPIIKRSTDGRLSFHDLIKVHVLRGLRVTQHTKLEGVREAARIAEEQYGVPELLISQELRFGGGRLFLDRLGELFELTPARQIVMRQLLIDYLARIDFGEGGLPRDFHPIERMPSNTGRKLILVSPFISFGRPVVKRLGVSTQAIADRLNAGETAESVVADYGLEDAELQEALAYEAA